VEKSFVKKKCTTPFIIWFNERSGSTHLTSLLNSHPEVTCFPEIFFKGEGLAKSDLFEKSKIADVPIFLDNLFSFQWGVNEPNIVIQTENMTPMAVGFKLKYNQLVKYPKVWSYLLNQKHKIKVIHIVRRNLLSTLVSSAMIPKLYAKFGRPNLHRNVSLEGVQRSVNLNPNTILDELKKLDAKITQNRQLILDFDTIEVSYENLLNHRNETCKRILRFLNVNDNETLSSNFQKIMSPSIENSINNIDAIRESIADSKYLKFLDSKF
jgi:hypothetical protein